MNKPRLINMPTEMPLREALFQAKNILEEEANRLVEARDNADPYHRIQIAIEREIVRLRLIARTLENELPKEIEVEG